MTLIRSWYLPSNDFIAKIVLQDPDPHFRIRITGNNQAVPAASVVELLLLTKRIEQCVLKPVTRSSDPDTCRHILIGLHIEIIYSKVGRLNAPQTQINAVRYKYVYGDWTRFRTQFQVSLLELSFSSIFEVARNAEQSFTIDYQPQKWC